MRHRPLSDAMGNIAAFQQAYDRHVGQPRSEPVGKVGVVFRLESKSTERITGHRVKAG
jgi:hypothetical protein